MVLGEKEAVTVVVSGDDVTTKGKEVKAFDGPVNDQAISITKPLLSDDNKEKKLRVLIVDDQAFTRLVHRAMVNSLGLESQLAENGKVAVDLHRAGATFDLILMDRDMPVMNGAQATKELRGMGVETKIVGVTAHEEGPDLKEFVDSGLNECFAKPISVPQIAALVKLVKEAKHQEAHKN